MPQALLEAGISAQAVAREDLDYVAEGMLPEGWGALRQAGPTHGRRRLPRVLPGVGHHAPEQDESGVINDSSDRTRQFT